MPMAVVCIYPSLSGTNHVTDPGLFGVTNYKSHAGEREARAIRERGRYPYHHFVAYGNASKLAGGHRPSLL